MYKTTCQQPDIVILSGHTRVERKWERKSYYERAAKTGNKVIGYVLLAVMAVSFLYLGCTRLSTGQAQMDVQTAFLTMLILLIIGEVISTGNQGIRAVHVYQCGIIRAGILGVFSQGYPAGRRYCSQPSSFLVMMMVVHLGTCLILRNLIEQWKYSCDYLRNDRR